MQTIATPKAYEFGPFQLHAEPCVLYLNNEIVSLTPKALAVLLTLVEEQGAVVTRQKLVDRVWPDTAVDDSSITKNISIVRKTLRDATGENAIQSISKIGYRFVLPVVPMLEDWERPVAADPEPLPGKGLQVDALRVDSFSPEPAPTRRGRNPWLLAAVFGLAVSVAAYVAIRNLRPTQQAPRQRPSVAVLPLKNLSPEHSMDWIGTGVAETMRAEMALAGQLEVLSSESVERSGATELSTDGIRKALGSRYVLRGSFLPVGDRVRIDLQLDDTASGSVAVRYSGTGTKATLFELVAEAGLKLRGSLDIPGIAKEGRPPRHQPTIQPEALQAWSEGTRMLRAGEVVPAAKRLEEAVRLAPDYAPAHASLSAAWALLGFDQRARDEARRALDASTNNSPEERLLVEAQYLESVPDWSKAVGTWEALRRFFPDDFDYVAGLAHAQTNAGKPKAALETLGHPTTTTSELRAVRLASARAEAYTALADWKMAEAQSEEAVAASKRLGSAFFEAQSLLIQGFALHRLGNDAQALSILEEADAIAARLKDQALTASVLDHKGEVLAARNDPSAADVLRQALEIEERIGYRRSASQTLRSLSTILRTKADYEGARRMLERALPLAREVGDGRGEVMTWINLGNLALNTGNAAKGKAEYGTALELARQISDRRGIAIATGNIAQIEFASGDVRSALARLEEALRLKRELGDKVSTAYTLAKLAETSLAAGDLRRARQYADEQAAILKSANIWGPRDMLIFAALAIEEGHPADAVPWMETLGAVSPKANPGEEAFRMLAAARLAGNEVAKARAAVDQAVSRAHMSTNRADFGIPADLMAARVEAAEGKPALALRHMGQLLAEAGGLGNYFLQLSIRLAIGETAARSADRAARTQLAQLGNDASAHGYGLVARHAESAIGTNAALVGHQ